MNNQTQVVQFHYLVKEFSFKHRDFVKRTVLEIFRREGRRPKHLNFIFCGDDYLLNINRTYLKHNTYTDIITFDLEPENPEVLADIYISVERVKDNADTFEIHFSEELRRVIFHGTLHLCGFKDKTLKEKRIMREKEAFYMSWFHVSRETRS